MRGRAGARAREGTQITHLSRRRLLATAEKERMSHLEAVAMEAMLRRLLHLRPVLSVPHRSRQKCTLAAQMKRSIDQVTRGA